MVPELSFTIPSIHDNTLLDCRVYHPTKSSATSSSFEKSCNNRGAIVAHPYTTLGGSYDDYIVVSTVSELLKLGFVVGTFNFRYDQEGSYEKHFRRLIDRYTEGLDPHKGKLAGQLKQNSRIMSLSSVSLCNTSTLSDLLSV